MSKDDCLCRHMLKIYNKDLRRYGEIKYDQHKEFNAIKWEEKKYYRMVKGRKYRGMVKKNYIVLMSQFDIDNDGIDETVIKNERVWYKGITSDAIYYFTGEDSETLKNTEFDAAVFKKATGKIGSSGAGFDGDVYLLKNLPKVSIGIVGIKEAYSHYLVGGYFYINPFLYDGAYYVDIKDLQEGPVNWLLILKYTPENKPIDICYYLKVCEGKSR